LIDNLEKRNLVVRVSHPTDRRINLIHLTSDGLALKGKTTKAVDRVVNQALEGISDEDLSLAREFLLKVMKNLENS
jgi:DNA-binding MarR family transcriptional regulator